MLGALSEIATPDSLGLALEAIDDRAVCDEAAAATVAIAGRLPRADRSHAETAMKRVLQSAAQPATRQRAEEVLGRPARPEKR